MFLLDEKNFHSKEITNIKSQGNSSFHLFFVEKATVAISYDLQSHVDDRLHRGWGREQKGWQNGKKDKQKKTQKKKRERERYTHTHIHTRSRSYNDDYNDNIITTIIIFIPSSSPFSLTLFLSLLLSFISNFLRTHSHEKICKKKFHHSSLPLSPSLFLSFFSL